MVSSAVAGRRAASTGASTSSVRTMRTPESRRMNATSGGVYAGLMLTTVAPRRKTANTPITYGGQLGNMMPMRSPFTMP